MSLRGCTYMQVTSSVTKILARNTPYRQCRHGLRFYSSRQAQSSKRELQTATAYRPHTLDAPFPPAAGNSGTPDTSISPAVPEENTPQQSQNPQTSRSTEANETISLPEREAQRSQHVADTSKSSSSTSSQSSTSKPRRSKLRARKAAMSLTPTAVSQLRGLLSQPEPKLIRVGVKNRGCSGLAYNLEYVEKPGAFDESVEQEGVKVLIDSKALFSIIGTEMDWQEDKLSSRFVFRNPNIKDQCGCGESFMV